MPSHTYLDAFIKRCSEAKPISRDDKWVGWEETVYILVGFGLRTLLPELREWLKLGAMVVTLKRLEIKKRLLSYAREKELDFAQAEQAAGVIVERIDAENLGSLVTALEEAPPDAADRR